MGSGFVRRVTDSSARLFSISLIMDVYTWRYLSDTHLLGGALFCGHVITTDGEDVLGVNLINCVMHMISVA